uniref:Uncharacterized protein n=1 Tax=Anguilla anguilla TaxID=7936 RepID=A0A0E9VRF5_ANGAN
MTAKSDSSGIINDIVETIVKHMKEKSECFVPWQKCLLEATTRT